MLLNHVHWLHFCSHEYPLRLCWFRDLGVLTSLGIEESTARLVRKLIVRRLAPRPVTISVEITLTCFKEVGIEAIRAALVRAALPLPAV